MEHLLLKAATQAATDEGVFQAVISTASVDRERDIVDPAGMVRALQKWVSTGKKIPLAWAHSSAPEHQIGYVDPATAKAMNGEVVVDGWIDQSTDAGAHAWRLVKMGTLGFSFGYLVPDGGATKRAGGGNHIKELDVFEVTASPTPMNNDTRVLGWKADTTPPPVEATTGDDLRKQADAVELEFVSGGASLKATAQTGDPAVRILNSMIGQAQEFIAGESDPEDIDAMGDILEALQDLLDEENTEPPEPEDQPKGLFPRAERQGARSGQLKAVWTTAYVNSLPDSSFLHVESGGSKDDEGKTTPRSLRYFPVKDENGNVDMAHVRNALARIPQSSLPQAVKDRCTAAAQRMLDASKAATGQTTRSNDPLRKQADAIELEFASGGQSLRKPPRTQKPSPPPELVPLKDLRRRMREEMLTALSGIEEP